SLSIGPSPVAQARQMIEQTRALTDRPFNINVFCHAPAQPDTALEAAWLEHLRPLFGEIGAAEPSALKVGYPSFVDDDAMLEMLLEQRPAVVSFHFGLPSADVLRPQRLAGICLLASATCLEQVSQIV